MLKGKAKHNIKKGESKSFKNENELLKWFQIHSSKEREFSLQCGKGNDKKGYKIVKN